MNDYFNFDIVQFNKEYSYGDLSGLEYIKKTIINNLKGDMVNYTRNDYIISLFYSVLSFNECIIATETGKDITENYIYDLYHNLKDLLFEELGMKYSYEYNMFYLKGDGNYE